MVLGAVNVDMVVRAPRLPAPGETVVGPGMERFGGGKGANAAVAAARAGGRVRYIGAVGDDDIGRQALRELQDDGVDTSGVLVSTASPTGVALIVVGPGGENQIAVGAGANGDVSAELVTAELARVLPGAGGVLVSTEIPEEAVAAAVRAAHGAGVRCILNPAPVVPVVAELLGLGPVLTPNAGECLALAGRPPADGAEPKRDQVLDAAHALVAVTGAEVVVTLGADGVLVVRPGGTSEHVPPRPATVRDTTGAGDTFSGVLALALARGVGLDDAVRIANAAAALSVAGEGARGGMPTADELVAAEPAAKALWNG
ncbi:ribokinase [Pseudonocardia thermophila]|uniref:Ribokinase n=1 Tax=Pseudonocardia thermophila TaxID=1848 RepID=A0A1M6RX85_PSETH|nr:ribokinase [Pseudonocardia thermophila]